MQTRLGAKFCDESTYRKLAESHVIGNEEMLQQDIDKSWKLNELCERAVAIDPCRTRLPGYATIAYTSGLIGQIIVLARFTSHRCKTQQKRATDAKVMRKSALHLAE